MANGDLLMMLQCSVRLRGAHSFRVVKVKGHASLEDVVEGRTTSRDRELNGIADHFAGTADGEFGPWRPRALEQAADRWEDYARLVELVQQVQAAVLASAITRDYGPQPALKRTKKVVVSALAPPARPPVELRRFGGLQWGAASGWRGALPGFFFGRGWQAGPGIPWIVLFVVFEVSMGVRVTLSQQRLSAASLRPLVTGLLA
eukprot:15440512-Alexandrium_andersonii.AAC.1